MVRLWPFILILAIACKTGAAKDDTTRAADPTLSGAEPESAETARFGSPAPPQSSILSEPLRPVRGGDKVLPPYTGPDPCKMALTGESPVAKACSDGGLRRANEMMQTFVKRARAAGIVFDCSDCHADEDDYSKLTPQAEPEFRKLLFLARPGD